jgi:hypothetical protein
MAATIARGALARLVEDDWLGCPFIDGLTPKG